MFSFSVNDTILLSIAPLSILCANMFFQLSQTFDIPNCSQSFIRSWETVFPSKKRINRSAFELCFFFGSILLQKIYVEVCDIKSSQNWFYLFVSVCEQYDDSSLKNDPLCVNVEWWWNMFDIFHMYWMHDSFLFILDELQSLYIQCCITANVYCCDI